MSALRPNVCAVVTDDAWAHVLVFRRTDRPEAPHAWQFPQGGMHPGEVPRQALHRELREEIGTDEVEVLRAAPEPIVYHYPPEVLEALRRDAASPEKARYAGQSQHWFLVRLRQGEAAIRFDHEPAEFDAYRWVSPQMALEAVVPFKREAYRQGLTALGLLVTA